MKLLILTIFALNVVQSKPMKETRYSSSAKSPIFQLLDQSSQEFSLPRFVLLPNYRNANETISIDYKSFSKSSTLIASSEWHLSVHIDQHFFQLGANGNGNGNNHSSAAAWSAVEQPVHVMCFLQFSMHSARKDVGRNASCRITLSSGGSATIAASCVISINRSPSMCSALLDVSKLRGNASATTWVSVTAELSFVPQSAVASSATTNGSSVIATSRNSAAIVINNPSLQPRNWTIVQQQTSSFGLFAIGLPLESMRIGATFAMPLSISEIGDLQLVRILIEYDSCLALHNVDVVDRTHWELETSFEHAPQNGASDYNKDSKNDRREFAILRFTSLNRQLLANDNSAPRELWPELAVANFTVTEKGSQTGCGIRAGIAKVKTFSGKPEKYFNKATFQSTQQFVPVAIDPENMVIIALEKPTSKPVHLFPSVNPHNTTEIFTYYLVKSGNQYVHQWVLTIECYYSQFSRGITNKGCSPQLFANSWVLPIRIEHWKTVVFNVFNAWQPETWKLNLSDSELNPIHGWRTYLGGKCVVMYQMAVLKVGVRLSTLNSFGITTYLGSSASEPAQWIDMSRDTDLSQLSSEPGNVVALSRTGMGHIMVTVNATLVTTLRLWSRDRHLLTSASVAVNSDKWTSVSRLVGRCIADIDMRRTDSHPSAEGSFVNVELFVPKLRPGDKCHLFLGVEFTDSSRLMLDDLAANNYVLEVNGIEFHNGNVVTYRSRINVTLHESVMCHEPRVVFAGTVDLAGTGASRPPPTSSSGGPGTSPGTPTHEPSTAAPTVDHRNSLSIAIYCVVGVIGMALLILLLNCVVGFNIRRHSIANIQRRLSKSKPYEGGTNSRKDNHAMGPLATTDEHYPPLLPPPGPIMSPGKQHTDWGVSSESGIGPERSSLGSQQDAIALSTFRVSIANGSTHPSDSSSYIHQTSPFADVIVEASSSNNNNNNNNISSSNNNSDSNYSTDQPPSPPFDAHPYLSQSYWSGLSAPFRLVPDHGHPPTECRIAHGHSRSPPDNRANSNLR